MAYMFAGATTNGINPAGYSITNIATATSTSSTSASLHDIALDTPLRPPHLEAAPGWLAPNGDYYPCNYDAHQRHGTTAWLILESLGIDPETVSDEQEYLLEMWRFIRVDIEDCMMAKGYEPSERQMNTLTQLLLLPLDETDEEWQHYTKLSIEDFIRKCQVAKKRALARKRKLKSD